MKEKMEEYRANGAQLGWLIEPLEKTVYVYRPSNEITLEVVRDGERLKLTGTLDQQPKPEEVG